MILTVVTTIGIAGGLIVIQTNQVKWLYYTFTGVTIFFNVVSGCLQGYQTIKNFTLKVSQAVEKGSKYGDMYRDIRLQFILPPKDRDEAGQYIKMVAKRWFELERERMFIRSSTQKACTEYFATLKTDDVLYDKLVPMPEEYVKPEREIAGKDIDPKKLGKIGRHIISLG